MHWRCDTCRGQIDDPRNGWVEWLLTPAGAYRRGSLRLVHSSVASPLLTGCQYNEQAEKARRNNALRDMRLDSLIAQGGEEQCRHFVEEEVWGADDGAVMSQRVARGDP